MTKHFCDRCQAELPREARKDGGFVTLCAALVLERNWNQPGTAFHIFERRMAGSDQTPMDICPACVDAVMKFIKGGRVKGRSHA